jgi:hypothetical protein
MGRTSVLRNGFFAGPALESCGPGDPPHVAEPYSERKAGHYGATGTVAWADAETGSAGINRHVVGDERALQERRSDSILTSSLAPAAARRQVKRR